MHENRPAFGQRLAELAELGVIEFRPKPLDAIVERRLKTIWEQRSCPHCGADSLHAPTGSDRIWCGRCDWKTTYTRGTPFYDSELTGGEFLVAFILYADTLLSITQIAALLSPCYTTLHDQLRELETAFCRGFPTVWERSPRQSMARHKSMKHSRYVRDSKAKTRRGRDSTAAGRPKEDARGGQVTRVTR